jgi:cellobiose-specific phosphotransferase system component IIB
MKMKIMMMNNLNKIQTFEQHSSELNISNVSESKLNNPHQMLVGYQYKITEPDYDEDGPEGNKPYIVEVIKKMKYGFILRDIEHNFTFERTFQHLMTCEIEEVYNTR